METNNNNSIEPTSVSDYTPAQWEIQRVAEACLEIASTLWPEAVGAYRQNVVS